MPNEGTEMVPVDAEHRELAVRVVRPLINIADTRQAIEEFKEFRDSLLGEDDWQTVRTKQGPKKFPKKSGRAALDIPFCVSHEIISERRLELPDGGYAWAFVVRAHHPTGRYEDGDGYCDSTEGRNKEHDVRASAVTRAKNRASFDLYGLGTVSAEEMSGHSSHVSESSSPGGAGPKRASDAASQGKKGQAQTQTPPGFTRRPSYLISSKGLRLGLYEKVGEARFKSGKHKGDLYTWHNVPDAVWNNLTTEELYFQEQEALEEIDGAPLADPDQDRVIEAIQDELGGEIQ
jgi:hypothetical protein